jgi:hypothetical protein
MNDSASTPSRIFFLASSGPRLRDSCTPRAGCGVWREGFVGSVSARDGRRDARGARRGDDETTALPRGVRRGGGTIGRRSIAAGFVLFVVVVVVTRLEVFADLPSRRRERGRVASERVRPRSEERPEQPSRGRERAHPGRRATRTDDDRDLADFSSGKQI